jgi:hypothetical protein
MILSRMSSLSDFYISASDFLDRTLRLYMMGLIKS